MSLSIRPVTTKRERRAFVNFPYEMYADVPQWVQVPRMAIAEQLNPKKNPFFKHADVELFLAERDGKIVGRISAQIDHNLNRINSTRWAQFGFFDCENSQETAEALLNAAAQWAKAKGSDRILGPFSFTTNDDCGLLVAGHSRKPIIMTSWHHPYMEDLIKNAGLHRVMDTLMWDLDGRNKDKVHPVIWRLAKRVDDEGRFESRYFSKKDLKNEVRRFLEVYHSAWENNWAFVPLSDDEIHYYANELKPLLDENWGMLISNKETGETVGAGLSLPDFNQAFMRARDGKLLPFGWLKILQDRKKIRRVRVFALGVKPGYEQEGIGAKLYEMQYLSSVSTPQVGGETGWTLESNVKINRAMNKMGAKISRRYRFFELMLDPSAEPQQAPDTRWTGNGVEMADGEPQAGVFED